ncbi:NAD(P)-dependent dehydrogenase, short-chain alcohol dehydrogenase family [Sphingobium sp. AP50]|uniref:SDR family oxidoreductase n=1 Tax=Sphingobium sp. AP50 TaxID=1884369 RepID=UPI0008D8A3A1|nr:SDR family oxidoreductase [Sphingobium sp. AP50]SEJ95145.1 NAD(P)-dependent dehydrogenase, short-chain alcohol dehydrogenase family [Sphingobium sp. AP50]
MSHRVIITAGASGIGLATARRFLASGAQVAVCDVNADAVRQAQEQHPELYGEAFDISSEEAVEHFVRNVRDAFGGIDTLVNNAGIAGACADIEDIPTEHWVRSFDVNVHGAFYFMRALVPVMKAQGGGAIINISTGSVFTLPVGRADYVASKWAIEGLTRAAAKELGPEGIRVNAIRPGFVNSARMKGILTAKAEVEGTTLEALEKTFLDFISMRTKVEPEEIGDMAVFLASDAARHVTGQLLSVDGNIEWEA